MAGNGWSYTNHRIAQLLVLQIAHSQVGLAVDAEWSYITPKMVILLGSWLVLARFGPV